MIPEEWLIDGYNLLNALSQQKPTRQKTALSREELFARLANFASQQKIKVCLVLDGSGVQAELHAHETSLLTIQYSQKVTADTLIERMLYEKRGQVNFIVVTNDRAISNHARGAGARVMSCLEFERLMAETHKESGDVGHKNEVRSHGFNRPFENKL